jgi:uncharacterized damage-inducible protein DinB
MPLSKTLCSLTQYNAWATQLFYRSVAKLPTEELTKPRGIGFGNMLRTLNHVYAMDLVWRAHLEGKPHGLNTRNPEFCPAFDELRALQSAMNQWYVRYAEELADPALDETLNFQFIGGNPGAMTRGEMLLHVVNHTTYHRGHVADMLWEVPAPPPTTDYPVFLRNAGSIEL